MATAGTIEVIASIDTSRYKLGAKEIDAANKSISGSTKEGGNAIEKLGSSLASMAKTGVKVAAVGLAALATTVASIAIGGGISRALNIEDAQAKLRGLGHDAQSVENIMNSALASVKGTAYGLDAAATIAASAVAAGVKPGQDLTKYLSLTADAATIAGVSLSEMGSIFNKVQTGQKAYTAELNQLADRGIPIYQWLQKELNVTQEELRDMVAEGKVDSQTYFNAIQKNIGGAALESGKTTRGSWANMLAALSRIGAQIVSGPINDLRGGFQWATTAIDENAGSIVSAVEKVVGFAKILAAGFVAVGKDVASYLSPRLQALAGAVTGQLIPALSELWKGVIAPLIPAIGSALVGAIGLAVDIMRIAVGVTSSLIGAIRPMIPMIAGVTAGYVAYRLAVLASNAVTAIQTGLLVLQQAQYVMLNGHLILVRGATIAQTIAQTALNTAMSMNPIGLVVAAVAGLTTAYFLATGQTDGTKSATDRLNQARREEKTAADNAKLANDNLSNAHLSASGSALAVERAQRSYNDAVAQYGPNSLEAREAAHQLRSAEEQLKDANNRVKTATEEKDKAEQLSADKRKAVESAEAEKKASFERTAGAITYSRDSVTELNRTLDILNGRTVSYNVKGNVDSSSAKGPDQRATGGPVSANRPYIVGENSDGSLNKTSELFVPRSAGRIINAKDLQSALGGGGGITNNISQVTIASEVDGERWLRRLSGNQEIVSNGLVPTQSYMG